MHKHTTSLWIFKEPISRNCLDIQTLIMLLHETMQNYNETNRKQTNMYMHCILYIHAYFPLRQLDKGEMLLPL